MASLNREGASTDREIHRARRDLRPAHRDLGSDDPGRRCVVREVPRARWDIRCAFRRSPAARRHVRGAYRDLRCAFGDLAIGDRDGPGQPPVGYRSPGDTSRCVAGWVSASRHDVSIARRDPPDPASVRPAARARGARSPVGRVPIGATDIPIARREVPASSTHGVTAATVSSISATPEPWNTSTRVMCHLMFIIPVPEPRQRSRRRPTTVCAARYPAHFPETGEMARSRSRTPTDSYEGFLERVLRSRTTCVFRYWFSKGRVRRTRRTSHATTPRTARDGAPRTDLSAERE